ncbi:MAG: hypothetical protein KBD66_03280 [Candidatus Doudnabacteria bacterium]|nr:hypothetical protein [Candidatus Doudnabacteria bacterium]
MENLAKEIKIEDATKLTEKADVGFQMSPEHAGGISGELSKLHDAIIHDKSIKIEDVENIDQLARNTKIDVGGEIMTVEEAEKVPDLKMNVEIWKEMRDGNFKNTVKITRITPQVSKYLENCPDINLYCLTSAKVVCVVTPRTFTSYG